MLGRGRALRERVFVAAAAALLHGRVCAGCLVMVVVLRWLLRGRHRRQRRSVAATFARAVRPAVPDPYAPGAVGWPVRSCGAAATRLRDAPRG